MRTFLCAVPPLLAGCFMLDVTSPVIGTATSEWYEIAPVSKPVPQVMEVARETVRRGGFTLLPSDGTDRIFTEWQLQLSPRLREGFRTKLEVEVVKLERGGVKVRVRGFREVNDDAYNPSNPSNAHWINASLDDKQKDRIPEDAIRVHQILKFKLLEN
jgi:hypothetical protein